MLLGKAINMPGSNSVISDSGGGGGEVINPPEDEMKQHVKAPGTAVTKEKNLYP